MACYLEMSTWWLERRKVFLFVYLVRELLKDRQMHTVAIILLVKRPIKVTFHIVKPSYQ